MALLTRIYKEGDMKRFWIVLLVLFVGCIPLGCLVQINPNDQVAKYETFGRNLGTYFKNTNPEFVEKSKAYIKGALALTDAELFAADVLQTAYDYALKYNPKNAELFLLIKSGIDMFGITIGIDEIMPDDRLKYVDSVRALLKGFAETSITKL